ncbi:hypothetical protein V8C44DRAFT_327059 [Trichoderma aethiopicum]
MFYSALSALPIRLRLADGIYGGRFLGGGFTQVEKWLDHPPSLAHCRDGKVAWIRDVRGISQGRSWGFTVLDLSQNAWLKALLLEILFIMLHDIHMLFAVYWFVFCLGGGAVLVSTLPL